MCRAPQVHIDGLCVVVQRCDYTTVSTERLRTLKEERIKLRMREMLYEAMGQKPGQKPAGTSGAPNGSAGASVPPRKPGLLDVLTRKVLSKLRPTVSISNVHVRFEELPGHAGCAAPCVAGCTLGQLTLRQSAQSYKLSDIGSLDWDVAGVGVYVQTTHQRSVLAAGFRRSFRPNQPSPPSGGGTIAADAALVNESVLKMRAILRALLANRAHPSWVVGPLHIRAQLHVNAGVVLRRSNRFRYPLAVLSTDLGAVDVRVTDTQAHAVLHAIGALVESKASRMYRRIWPAGRPSEERARARWHAAIRSVQRNQPRAEGAWWTLSRAIRMLSAKQAYEALVAQTLRLATNPADLSDVLRARRRLSASAQIELEHWEVSLTMRRSKEPIVPQPARLSAPASLRQCAAMRARPPTWLSAWRRPLSAQAWLPARVLSTWRLVAKQRFERAREAQALPTEPSAGSAAVAPARLLKPRAAFVGRIRSPFAWGRGGKTSTAGAAGTVGTRSTKAPRSPRGRGPPMHVSLHNLFSNAELFREGLELHGEEAWRLSETEMGNVIHELADGDDDEAEAADGTADGAGGVAVGVDGAALGAEAPTHALFLGAPPEWSLAIIHVTAARLRLDLVTEAPAAADSAEAASAHADRASGASVGTPVVRIELGVLAARTHLPPPGAVATGGGSGGGEVRTSFAVGNVAIDCGLELGSAALTPMLHIPGRSEGHVTDDEMGGALPAVTRYKQVPPTALASSAEKRPPAAGLPYADVDNAATPTPAMGSGAGARALAEVATQPPPPTQPLALHASARGDGAVDVRVGGRLDLKLSPSLWSVWSSFFAPLVAPFERLPIAAAARTEMISLVREKASLLLRPPWWMLHTILRDVFQAPANLLDAVGGTSLQVDISEGLGASLLGFANGLRWEPLAARPSLGVELRNEALANALRSRSEFSLEELSRFGVERVRSDHYVVLVSAATDADADDVAGATIGAIAGVTAGTTGATATGATAPGEDRVGCCIRYWRPVPPEVMGVELPPVVLKSRSLSATPAVAASGADGLNGGPMPSSASCALVTIEMSGEICLSAHDHTDVKAAVSDVMTVASPQSHELLSPWRLPMLAQPAAARAPPPIREPSALVAPLSGYEVARPPPAPPAHEAASDSVAHGVEPPERASVAETAVQRLELLSARLGQQLAMLQTPPDAAAASDPSALRAELAELRRLVHSLDERLRKAGQTREPPPAASRTVRGGLLGWCLPRSGGKGIGSLADVEVPTPLAVATDDDDAQRRARKAEGPSAILLSNKL